MEKNQQRVRLSLCAAVTAISAVMLGCSGGGGNDLEEDAGSRRDASGSNGDGALSDVKATDGRNDASDAIVILPDASDTGSPVVNNPETCEEAVASKSYIGCDYWPTVTYNNEIDPVFDFAVVISNTGKQNAQIRITGAGADISLDIPPGTLETIHLPWVALLLSGTQSAHVPNGAYHLVSSRPVTVYQFNALQYEKEKQYSFTNDASLLLPSSAMTGNYRVATWADAPSQIYPSFFAITATQDDTNVKIWASANTAAGTGINAIGANTTGTTQMQAGDVLVIMADGNTTDISGSVIQADKPVQAISGNPCTRVPDNFGACDHVEESLFPAEALGNDYLVTVPGAPRDPSTAAVGQHVRIVGNFDGTELTFDPPLSAPGIVGGKATVNAGQVLDLGLVAEDFRVSSEEHSFIVATFIPGASLIDPGVEPPNQKGDPAQSFATAVKQYRTEYLFLAPADYDTNVVNVTAPRGAQVTIDGAVLAPDQFQPIGSTGMGVWRHPLQATGSHKLSSDQPVGIQVYGYGSYTSYQYPGGTNLNAIAPPPVVH